MKIDIDIELSSLEPIVNRLAVAIADDLSIDDSAIVLGNFAEIFILICTVSMLKDMPQGREVELIRKADDVIDIFKPALIDCVREHLAENNIPDPWANLAGSINQKTYEQILRELDDEKKH